MRVVCTDPSYLPELRGYLEQSPEDRNDSLPRVRRHRRSAADWAGQARLDRHVVIERRAGSDRGGAAGLVDAEGELERRGSAVGGANPVAQWFRCRLGSG